MFLSCDCFVKFRYCQHFKINVLKTDAWKLVALQSSGRRYVLKKFLPALDLNSDLKCFCEEYFPETESCTCPGCTPLQNQADEKRNRVEKKMLSVMAFLAYRIHVRTLQNVYAPEKIFGRHFSTHFCKSENKDSAHYLALSVLEDLKSTERFQSTGLLCFLHYLLLCLLALSFHYPSPVPPFFSLPLYDSNQLHIMPLFSHIPTMLQACIKVMVN